MVEHEIEITYPCGLQDDYCDMIGCDDCNSWYHKFCVKFSCVCVGNLHAFLHLNIITSFIHSNYATFLLNSVKFIS